MIYILLAAVNFLLLAVNLSIWLAYHGPLNIVAVIVSGTVGVFILGMGAWARG